MTLPDSDRLVLLITQEQKPDWWELDAKGQPLRPHPALVQEMRDQADAHLWLTSLADFVRAAGAHLTPGDISRQAVDELRRATSVSGDYPREARDRYGTDPVHLLDLSPKEFEWLALALFSAMGYREGFTPDRYTVDLAIHGDGAFGSGEFFVKARRSRGTFDLQSIHALYGVMKANNVSGGVVITTGSFGLGAQAFAIETGIHLVGGDDLARLLADHLGIDGRMDSSRAA